MKKCGTCKKKKPKSAFNKKQGDLLQSYCRDCQKAYKADHYARNRKRAIATMRARRKRLREQVRELKHNKKCLDCKKKYPYWLMDFDHRDSSKKSDDISNMVHSSSSFERILKEVKKCDLVCSNCHRDRTHRRRAA